MMEKPKTLRVGSLNIWGVFGDWPARLQALQQHPLVPTLDVLLAQEVCVGPELDQVHELAKAFGLYYHEFHSDKTINGNAEGVAIFARKPLSTVGRVNLGSGRVLIQADTPDGITLASAHLSFEGRERSEQVKALLKRVTLNKVVLGADFNGDLSTFEEALDKYWADSTDPTPTWPVCGEAEFIKAWVEQTGKPVTFSLQPYRVDYILTRGLGHMGSYTVALEHDGQYVSDHALVISEVLI